MLTRLWYEGNLELGTEGVDDLALPSKERPLVTGHSKARLAAISELANARSRTDLPELLLALRDPANAGEHWRDVRRALYRAITWFDVPAVWEAVFDGLRSEDPNTRSLLEDLSWRLEGLAQERSAELADARAVRV